MRAVRKIVTVPASRELRIQLPEEAAPHEEAEVIILFKRSAAGADDKLSAMREAASDELFLADLAEVAEDFARADEDEYAA
ncbi:MAG TPA: hypothetical protein VF654_11145 [Pyrinomonadaceae bacterium]|jgi:hypothetical protein